MTPKELYFSILKLAFSGKLLPQIQCESTESFISITSIEKQRLEKNGEIKKHKKVTSEIDEPFDIPQNWQWMRMIEFCTDIFSGKSPKYEKSENEYRVIGQAANQEKGLDYSLLKYTNRDFWKSNEPKMFVRKYDVLLNTLGNGTLGRSGIVKHVPFPMLTDGHPFVFRTSNPTSSYFLYYYLQLKRSDIEKSAYGSTNQTFLNLSSTILWPIPVAPLEEQKRIVSKIEELLPLVDRYEEAWNKLEKLNKDFPDDMINSIVNFAMQGKLTRQNHDEENAESVLQTIKEKLLNEANVREKDRIKHLFDEDVDSELIPFELPVNWKWCRWGCLVNVVSARRVHKSDWRNDGVPFYRAREIGKLAEHGFVNNELFITEDLYKQFSKSGVPKPGDLMVTAVGTLGKTYVVKDNDRFYYKDASVICLENRNGMDPNYLKLVMESPLMSAQIKSNSSGTTVATLTIERMNEYIIPLPPLEEQKRIVAKLDELLPLCRKLVK